TVLCDGCLVGSVATAETDPQALARMMVARDASTTAEDVLAESAAAPRRPRAAAPAGPVALSVAGLCVAGDAGRGAVENVDIEVRQGEIVGVAGVSGNGQRELSDAIAGLRAPSAGRVELGGRDVTRASVRERIAAGLGYVPEDRFARGVAAGLTLEDNLILRHYWQRRFRRGPFLARGPLNRWVGERRERVEIKGARAGLRVSILSGGNVQRAILAREIGEDTTALVACSPTRGLDVGVTGTVHELLREQRDRGLAVLLVSEDLEEVLSLSDRVLVMYEGRVVGQVDAISADPERIGLMMAGSGDPS
ncbi:MAG TPA: ATP-binding cassette domain-containing protein, partial [Conexibacter sp.]|nr:ATP-binding cassette domain-containing protein [Conexibacter sp.]